MATMLLPPEFKRLLNAFHSKGVDEIDGVTFSECFARRVQAEIDGVKVCVISLSDLKVNKQASGRNKDLADLDYLP